jgi:hypothetical protein
VARPRPASAVVALGLAGLVALCAVPARADALLDRLLAQSSAAPLRAFERTSRITEADRPERVEIDRFDPEAGEGRRWTLISVDGHAPDAAETSRYRHRVEGQPVPGFHRLHLLLAGKAERRRDGAALLYHWDRLEPGALGTSGPDLARRMAADARVVETPGGPMIDWVRVYTPKSFSMMVVATIHRIEHVSIYRRGEDGVPFLQEQDGLVDARIPFRQSGPVRTRSSFRPL